MFTIDNTMYTQKKCDDLNAEFWARWEACEFAFEDFDEAQNIFAADVARRDEP